MRFNLSDSPFRNFSKYDSDNIFEFLLPVAKNFCDAQRVENDKPIPPSAFVLRGDTGTYFNGYGFRAPEDFTAELSLEAQTADAIVTLAEFGSMSQDFSRGLIVICAQTRRYYRCRAFSLATGEEYEVLDGPLRIELQEEEFVATEEHTENVCHLLGVESLLHPLF